MGYGYYSRHPKTANEMKQYFASIENEPSIPLKIRGRRKPKHLPNSWDDIDRHFIRSWKYYRKNQWRV